MATRKFIIVAGQSNASPIGDAQSWEDANRWVALRSPQYDTDRSLQFAQGSSSDRITLPGTWYGGPQVDILGATISGQWQNPNLRGVASQQIRFLTFYNPIGHAQTFNSYRPDYPGTGRITGGRSDQITTNVLSQPSGRIAAFDNGYLVTYNTGVGTPFTVGETVTIDGSVTATVLQHEALTATEGILLIGQTSDSAAPSAAESLSGGTSSATATVVSSTAYGPAVSTSTGLITTAAAHTFLTSDILSLTSTSTTGIPGNWDGTRAYLAEVVDANNLYLHPWPEGDVEDSSDRVIPTAAGSGTLKLHEAARGEITRLRTNTTHTVACGGPGTQGSATATGYHLNVGTPLIPVPDAGEQFTYQLKVESGVVAPTATKFATNFALGGLSYSGASAMPCKMNTPDEGGPMQLRCKDYPMYEGRTVQFSTSAATLVIGEIVTAVDTGAADLIAVQSGNLIQEGDAIMFSVVSGALAPLVSGTVYYAVNVQNFAGGTNNAFQVEASRGGGAINLTSWTPGLFGFTCIDPTDDRIKSIATPEVGDLVTYTTSGTDIGGLTNLSSYYVIDVDSYGAYQLSSTRYGSAIDITSGTLDVHNITGVAPAPITPATNYYITRVEEPSAGLIQLDATYVDTSGNTVQFLSGFSPDVLDGEEVQLVGTDLPDPLVSGRSYYVRLTGTAGTIQLTETPFGAAISLTDEGSGFAAVSRPESGYIFYVSLTPGGKEVVATLGDTGVNSTFLPNVIEQPLFSGSLTGTRAQFTTGTQSVIDGGPKHLSHVERDSVNDLAVVNMGESLPAAPADNSVFVINPQQVNGVDIDWDEWAMLLPWSPFEGRAQGQPVPATVTFSAGRLDLDGNLALLAVNGLVGTLSVGDAIRLYTSERLPRPLKVNTTYYVTTVAASAVYISETYGGSSIYPTWERVASADVSDNVVFSSAHGFQENEPLRFTGTEVATMGLSTATVYYAVNVTATTLQVALTPGGAAESVNDQSYTDVYVQLGYSFTATHRASQVDQFDKFNPYPPGFNFPNHETIPQVYQPYRGGGIMSVRPRQGISVGTGFAVAESLGEPVDIVALAFGGTSIAHKEIMPSPYVGNEGIGWVDIKQQLSWAPGEPNTCYARLEKTLTALKRAYDQDGDTGECVGIWWIQGEEDASYPETAPSYFENLERLKSSIRALIKSKSLYSGDADTIPWLHPPIRTVDDSVPAVARWNYASTINTAIDDAVARDPYMRTLTTTVVDALPLMEDNVHYSGAGMDTLTDALMVEWRELRKRESNKVEIANLALSFVGETASVTSLFPSDGSRQADICAQFFDIALRATLQRHRWDFNTKRFTPTSSDSGRVDWPYKYQMPSDFLGVINCIPVSIADDQELAGEPVELSYSIEVDDLDRRWLYAKQDTLQVRYQAYVDDTAKWPPLFRKAMGYNLGTMIAPPLIKGEEGVAMANNAMQMYEMAIREAAAFDARSTRDVPDLRERKATWDQR